METKICRTCGKEKQLDLFKLRYYYNGVKRRSMRSSVCAWCYQNRQHHPKNPAAYATERARRRLKHIRDRFKGEFDLDNSWVVGHTKCEVSGLPFDNTKKIFMSSIDRVDPNRGYTKDNCRVVCWGYNAMKLDCTDEDVLKLAMAIIKNEAKKRGLELKLVPPELPNHCVS